MLILAKMDFSEIGRHRQSMLGRFMKNLSDAYTSTHNINIFYDSFVGPACSAESTTARSTRSRFSPNRRTGENYFFH